MAGPFNRCYLRIFYLLCLGAALGLWLRMYAFSSFWLDDFNNLFWVQRISWWQLLLHNLNPTSDYFRPLGMAYYWLNWRIFDLHPLPYHLFAWSIHALNVALVWRTLTCLLDSEYAAVFGALLFSFNAIIQEVFWNHSTIFELLCAALYLTGLLLYLRSRDSKGWHLLLYAVYLLALKSKETAITLPLLWLWYEIGLGKPRLFSRAPGQSIRLQVAAAGLRRLLRSSFLPLITALWLVHLRSRWAAENGPADPYYVNLSFATMTEGFGWYLNQLSRIQLPSGVWGAIVGLFSVGFIFKRNATGLFFFGYIFLSFLPVIFLPNHRFAFYWYIPFLGLSGLAGLLVKWVAMHANKLLRPARAAAIGALAFALACGFHFQHQVRRSQASRAWAEGVAQEYRSFISGLRKLPRPPADETIYYASTPRFFDTDSLLSATQLAFGRMDLQAKKVEAFPPEARYRVRFENSTVIFASAQTTTPLPKVP